MLRTHTCGELRAGDVGTTVTLAGWVNRRRDFGGLIFLDLRDREGLTQVVFDPADGPEAHAAASGVGLEWVLAVDGTVRGRPEGQANPDMPTGEVEVVAGALRVLNPARTTPFEIGREVHVEDAQRLRYRYLDLRRRRMQRNLRLRHRVTAFIRRFLDARDFVDVETPILQKSTPEGARDFLVPSRVHPGRFYALPQSPQQLKQLLMVAGFDRYYQIARCFRDEDLRADRELEFTQLDLEMTFVEAEDVLALIEPMFVELSAEVAPHMRLRETPFPRLTYDEAMARFGTDKPDLRFGLELIDLGPDLAGTGFRVFSGALAGGGQVKAIVAPRTYSRKEIGELEGLVKAMGAGGLAWLAFEDGSARGSVAKFLSDDEIAAVRARAGAAEGQTMLIMAGDADLVAKCLDRLRREVAHAEGLVPDDELAFMWLVDPPLFEYDAEGERWDSVHHPFTAPQARDVERLSAEPGRVRADAYDIVCNGFELGGGSIRIHERAVQSTVFDLLGLEEAEAAAQFGHMLDAFDYGAPPHGGIAVGLDRTVAIFAGEPNIRDVIAFPKSLSAVDLMTGSPSDVPEAQIAALGLRLAAPPPPAAPSDGSPTPGAIPSPRERETHP